MQQIIQYMNVIKIRDKPERNIVLWNAIKFNSGVRLKYATEVQLVEKYHRNKNKRFA